MMGKRRDRREAGNELAAGRLPSLSGFSDDYLLNLMGEIQFELATRHPEKRNPQVSWRQFILAKSIRDKALKKLGYKR